VTAAHILVTVLEFHEVLTAAGRELPEAVAGGNTAGTIVARQGIRLPEAIRAAARLAPDNEDDEPSYDNVHRPGWMAIRIRQGDSHLRVHRFAGAAQSKPRCERARPSLCRHHSPGCRSAQGFHRAHRTAAAPPWP
jgi:hypothetical protein